MSSRYSIQQAPSRQATTNTPDSGLVPSRGATRKEVSAQVPVRCSKVMWRKRVLQVVVLQVILFNAFSFYYYSFTKKQPEFATSKTFQDALEVVESFKKSLAELSEDKRVTLVKLYETGLTQLQIFNATNGDISKIPPWSQIVDNFGEEPVILGLDRCEEYRNTVAPRKRLIAPTGMFSTGTNAITYLLVENCRSPPPHGGYFILWQVPWGKHNPESARNQLTAKNYDKFNNSAVLPIVTVRHPLSWMDALCTHFYSLHWMHNPNLCEKTKALNKPVSARLGVGLVKYDSLADVWKDWNLEYFKQLRHQQQQINDATATTTNTNSKANKDTFPFLIVRHEDLVYRPKQVIKAICNCAGGKMRNKFRYKTDPAIVGTGHGTHSSSDLAATWIKHGKPLSLYREKFSKQDWKIIDTVFREDHMTKALNYTWV